MDRARLIGVAAAASLVISVAAAHGGQTTVEELRGHLHKSDDAAAQVPSSRLVDLPCTGGLAGPFPCDGVDLLSFVPLSEFAGTELPRIPAELSDIWGWTDTERGDEYVIVGKTNGAAFFRVTDPRAPEYLGDLVNPSVQRVWHDIKVIGDRAFIVSESQGHGMKVFDLTRLRRARAPRTWVEDARHPLTFAAHNVAANEETGFVYVVGGNVGLMGPDNCNQGLHMVDVKGPLPVLAGCYITDGYVHDTQCVVYRGPDEEHAGREICLNSAETAVSIVDVTDKLLPRIIGFLTYDRVGYTHQGWLTEDHSFFLLGDEQDETSHDTNTRTIIVDVRDLDAPQVIGEHFGSTPAIDHNMYVRDGLVYQSNYTAGLRVLDTANVAEGRLTEIASFDTYPNGDPPIFNGTWSNYPYFASGTIAVTGINEGLFLLKLAP